MERVKQENSLQELELMFLRECHNITMDSLVDMAVRENSLGHLGLHHCRQITLCDVQLCRKKIATEKLQDDITIDWS